MVGLGACPDRSSQSGSADLDHAACAAGHLATSFALPADTAWTRWPVLPPRGTHKAARSDTTGGVTALPRLCHSLAAAAGPRSRRPPANNPAPKTQDMALLTTGHVATRKADAAVNPNVNLAR